MSSRISLLMCLEHVVTCMRPLQVVCLCVLCCAALCGVQQCRIFTSSPGCPSSSAIFHLVTFVNSKKLYEHMFARF